MGLLLISASGPAALDTPTLQQGQPWADGGARGQYRGGTDRSSGLRFLQGLVETLLGKETPAHIRAAMAVLGAVRCHRQRQPGALRSPSSDVVGDPRGYASTSPAALADVVTSTTGGTGKSCGGWDEDIAALSRLLDILCQVFDCAWASEGRAPIIASNDLLAVQASAAAPSASFGTSPTPSFGFPQVSLLNPKETRGAVSPGEPGPFGTLWNTNSQPNVHRKPLVQVEAGVGHRVLVQVLQVWASLGSKHHLIIDSKCLLHFLNTHAPLHPCLLHFLNTHAPLHPCQSWKSLRDAGGDGVAAALGRTGWLARVNAAKGHDRR